MLLSKSDVNECLALAVASFPNFPLSVPTVNAYHELLSDLNCDKTMLYSAIKRVIRTCNWFPTVAQIIKEVDVEIALIESENARPALERQLEEANERREMIAKWNA